MMKSKVSNHLITANPGNIKIRTYWGLDFYASFQWILNNGILAIWHSHLEGDIRFRFCLINQSNLAKRNSWRQRSIRTYGKSPYGSDLARWKSCGGCHICRWDGRRGGTASCRDRSGRQVSDWRCRCKCSGWSIACSKDKRG